MTACLHDDEFPLRESFQLIRRHQCLPRHLEGLTWIVFALVNVTCLDGTAAQGIGQHLRRLAPGGEATEYDVLGVVLDDLAALLAVSSSPAGPGTG